MSIPTKYKWRKATKRQHSPWGRIVLLCIESDEDSGLPGSVIVGYCKNYSDGPFYIMPGVGRRERKITHFCDCLGNDFHAECWDNKTMNQLDPPKEQNESCSVCDANGKIWYKFPYPDKLRVGNVFYLIVGEWRECKICKGTGKKKKKKKND